MLTTRPTHSYTATSFYPPAYCALARRHLRSFPHLSHETVKGTNGKFRPVSPNASSADTGVEVYRFHVTGMTGHMHEYEASSIRQLRMNLAKELRIFYPCVILVRRNAEHVSEPMHDFDYDIEAEFDGAPQPFDVYLINAQATMEKDMSAWSAEKWIEVLQDHILHEDETAIARARPKLGQHVASGMDTLLQTVITHSHTVEQLEEEAARIRLILQLGVDTSTRGRNGMTMLHCAAELGHMGLLHTWLRLGDLLDEHTAGTASVDIDTANYSGRTSLYLAASNGHTEVVKALVASRASHVVASGDCERTPLHVAARRGHANIIRILLQAMAQVDLGDNGGRTALHLAAAYGHTQAVQALVTQGNAHLGAVDRLYGRAAIHMASRCGHTPVVAMLVDARADVNATDEDLWTPLHLAASMGRLETIGVLIRAGANRRARNEEGNTPLDLAFGDGIEGITRGAFFSSRCACQ